MALYLLGSLARPPVAIVAAVCIVLGGIRAWRPKAVPKGGILVPRHWERWGDTWFLFVFGLFLGFGFITTLPSVTMLALALGVWYLHNLYAGLVIWTMFAFGRFALALWTGYENRRRSTRYAVGVPRVRTSQTADQIIDRLGPAGVIETLVFVSFGLALLIMKG